MCCAGAKEVSLQALRQAQAAAAKALNPHQASRNITSVARLPASHCLAQAFLALLGMLYNDMRPWTDVAL